MGPSSHHTLNRRAAAAHSRRRAVGRVADSTAPPRPSGSGSRPGGRSVGGRDERGRIIGRAPVGGRGAACDDDT
jgi:hypothetical protein